ncbi:phenylacrylic acid decarboxylase, putaytive [Candida dubliniensis CD36]|uniref:Flavin prenyltransferase PAD1, mitochondrial n=1 Tax=Candida dubliniensis (strain CD36 / ATCC MYA-646 / CBS 7987 / NCPF 3949 / NRRL Y-17841) TaxID=573826 RepID=B9WJ67_CANDC|nr:phenylacrylic acid decarboxylase, putaytive [Candida dubliniensis CD36]CAX41288.1 phenylacrylic acid decarboxylase, putaytive [Candida dubliniensis CD36]
MIARVCLKRPNALPIFSISSRKYSIDYEKVNNSVYNNVIIPKRIVLAITGATGTQIGVRLLEILKELGVETHLVMSKWGIATLKYETDYQVDYVTSLATKTYSARDVTAPISSGSFVHDGMIVAPCSMKSLSAIRTGFTEDLIVRAADVSLKERRKLLLVARETPLSDIHLDNMLYLSRMGVIIFPPVPAFYTKPKTVDDIIEQTCGRILDNFGINIDTFERWDGINHK